MAAPLVSICVFSFNYEKYIAECLDSILQQETSFPFEVIIGDDHSTDNTRKVVEAYISRYPDTIRLLPEEPNMGGTRNWIRTMNAAQGRYIAVIDGDDYFCDRNKLQEQFDLLEQRADANLCFHGVKETYESGPVQEKDFIAEKQEYTTADILRQGWFIRTGSLFFRNHVLPSAPPEWVYRFPYRYDTILIVILTNGSKALNIGKVMTVWRRHSAGLSYMITRDRVKNYLTEKALYAELDQLTGKQYVPSINRYIKTVRTNAVAFLLKRLAFRELFKLRLIDFLQLDFSLLCADLFGALFRKIKK